MAKEIATKKQGVLREPLFHIVKRATIPLWKSWMIRLIAILAAFLVCGIITFLLVGENPLDMYSAMFRGSFGTPRKIWKLIKDLSILLCISLAVTPAFRMKFWNIGAEGQVLIGCLATTACLFYLGGKIPDGLLILLMLITAILAGAIWGLIPAIFKAKWNTNETLFTLMMNYVAIQITSYCVSLWENPFGSNTVGIINSKTKAGWFPAFLEKGQGEHLAAWLRDILQNSVCLNVLLVMLLAVGMFLYLKYSKQGYEIAVLGESERTARYAGIKPAWVFIRTMAISGAICGMAGFIAVAGASHTISTSTAGGRGFTAIIVAWLAKFNTFVMLLIALLLVFLEKGAIQIASDFQLNDFASKVVTGIVLFCIIASEFFINYRLVFRFRKGAEAE